LRHGRSLPERRGGGLSHVDRRRLLHTASALSGLSAVGLGGCVEQAATASAPIVPPFAPAPSLAAVRASEDRIIDVTVCLRPFRAEGPRLDVEPLGGKTVVHNYGHGGSGWSLSWGSSTIAIERAMAASPSAVAVIGCGALGLTSAILAQRAGARVTIYAKDLLPQTRSARAIGSWTPDSRIALESKAAANFPALWERMARTSFKTYRTYLGLPGAPVEFSDRYIIHAHPDPDGAPKTLQPELDFMSLSERLSDFGAPSVVLPAGATPFPGPVRRFTSLQFNIADYGHMLMDDFLLAGGRVQRREFHDPSELAALAEPVVINCTGYGARALWKDASIVPVRGQVTWLIPQPEVTYGVLYDGVNMLARRDGIVLQLTDGSDMLGYDDDNETPDAAEARTVVDRIARLYPRA